MEKAEDIRITKTVNLLVCTMLTLLNKRSFRKIAVNDICEEALVCRATFYSKFYSKYDLLQYWLHTIEQNIPENVSAYNETEIITAVNFFMRKNSKIVKNIVNDADELVVDLLHESIISALNRVFCPMTDVTTNSNETLLKFSAGGILSIINWNIKNKNQLNSDFVSIEIYQILKLLWT